METRIARQQSVIVEDMQPLFLTRSAADRTQLGPQHETEALRFIPRKFRGRATACSAGNLASRSEKTLHSAVSCG